MRTLATGESNTYRIESRPRWVHTDLTLTPDATYRMSATGLWVDKSERYTCGPDGYDSDKWFLSLTEGCRSAPSQRWFALIGALDEHEKSQFKIGENAEYRPRVGGELTCYANDIWFMRHNNSGHVMLTVERVD